MIFVPIFLTGLNYILGIDFPMYIFFAIFGGFVGVHYGQIGHRRFYKHLCVLMILLILAIATWPIQMELFEIARSKGAENNILIDFSTMQKIIEVLYFFSSFYGPLLLIWSGFILVDHLEKKNANNTDDEA
ncbi:hypothetical protein [Hydromonas duriensis]|nr:hypothetical protein [Hydromonas duriensis]